MPPTDCSGLFLSESRPLIPGDWPQAVGDILDRAVAEDGGREALVARYGRYTYVELDRAVNRAAAVLARLGVRAGDRVAASTHNHAEIVVAFLASQRLGAVWVGINRVLTAAEKAFMLHDSATSVMLADRAVAEQVGEFRNELPDLRHLVLMDPGDESSEWPSLLADAADESRPAVEVDPFAPAAIAYTSGTTGFPKGVVHSQHNMLLPGAVIVTRARAYTTDMRNGVVLPLTILNIMVLQPLVSFGVGACSVLIDRIDPVGMAEWIRNERVTVLMTVPPLMHDLLTSPDVSPDDLATVKVAGVGGSHTPAPLKQLYAERFGTEPTTGYGLTEAPTAVAQQNPSRIVPGSSGVALPQVRLSIVDGDDKPVPVGDEGEICIAPATDGPWARVYTPMLGYWGRPEETAEALRGGLLHTGDLGHMDEFGNLFVHDRRTDLILRGGANVYPAEVERVLHEDLRIEACAVLGRPDDRLGEEVVAFVQLAPGATATVEELVTHCRKQLARYKVPKEIFFVDEMPRNAMDKIVKGDLRGRYLERETRWRGRTALWTEAR